MASKIPEQPKSHLGLTPLLLPLRAWECIFIADCLIQWDSYHFIHSPGTLSSLYRCLCSFWADEYDLQPIKWFNKFLIR